MTHKTAKINFTNWGPVEIIGSFSVLHSLCVVNDGLYMLLQEAHHEMRQRTWTFFMTTS